MSWEGTTRKAMEMTDEELVIWGIGNNDNPIRRATAELEFQRRSVHAQIEAANAATKTAVWMRWSVIIALGIGIGGWLVSLFVK